MGHGYIGNVPYMMMMVVVMVMMMMVIPNSLLDFYVD